MTGHEILIALAPPIEVINHFTELFEIHRKKNHPTPQACLDWLALWQDIRSDKATAIDGATAEAWLAVGKTVERTKEQVTR